MKTYFEVLQKYFVFTGRASRREFWLFQLENLLPTLILFVLSMVFSGSHSVLFDIFITLYYLYAIAVVLPSLGVLVRRLHDTNHSGWWYFIAIIPIIGILILLVFLCTGSDAGENKYGSNPKMGVSPKMDSGSAASDVPVSDAEFKEVG